MATISNLVVEISAKTDKLKRQLEKSKLSITKFATNAVKKMAKIGAALALGIVAASAAVVKTISTVAKKIDNLAKTSSKLGIGVVELEKLRFSAELAGVSINNLDIGLQRMVRRISEAAVGTGAAQKALVELKLSAMALNKLSPDQQFAKIAEAMSKIANQGDRVKLAMQIFDTEGVGLVNLFNDSLKETGLQFEALGLGISSFQAKAVESFNDSKTVLGAIFDDFLKKVTANVSPAFEAIIKAVVKTITKMGGLGEVSSSVAKILVTGMTAALKAIQFVRNAVEGIGIAFDAVVIAVLKAIKVLAQFGAAAVKFLNVGPDDLLAGVAEGVERDAKVADRLISGLEKSLSKRISNFGKNTEIAPLQDLIRDLDKAKSNITSDKGIVDKFKSGKNTITLEDTKRLISSGTQHISVNVNANSKTKELFDFVVDNPEFAERIDAKVEQKTQDSRRRTTR